MQKNKIFCKERVFFVGSLFFVITLIFFRSVNIAWAENEPPSSDPYVEQWGYKTTGVYKAWKTTTGSRHVVVAVIDNGFDMTHPDIRGNVWKNTHEIPDNGIDDDHNGYIDDVWGWNFVGEDNNPNPNLTQLSSSERQEELYNHGTVVAGIIGAVGNNNRDGAGINWKVRLMNLKILNNTGAGKEAQIARAIHYAVDNGAAIINVSVVGALDEYIKEAVRYAYEHGVAIFAAAGNIMTNLNEYPAGPVCVDANTSSTEVLGVSAIGPDRKLAIFSNYGSHCIDITAPGIGVSSTVQFIPALGITTTYEGGWSGTSVATPYVSGVAALVKSVAPQFRADDIYQALLTTTHHTPALDEDAYKSIYGKGLVQADKAVTYAREHHYFRPDVADDLITTSLKSGPKSDYWKMVDFTNQFGVRRTVTVTQKGKMQSEVVVSDENGYKLSSWRVPLSGALQITASNVTGDLEPEIIIAPKTSNNTVFQVFDLKGKKLDVVTLAQKHTGATIGIVRDVVTGLGQVAVFYKDKDGFAVHLYSGSQEIARYPLDPAMGNPRSFIVGDFNGDGDDEFAVLGTIDRLPSVLIMNEEGNLSLQFSVGSAGATDLIAVRFDQYDGARDGIFVIDRKGKSQQLWSGQAQLLQP